MRRLLILSIFIILGSQPLAADGWKNFTQKSPEDKNTFVALAIAKKYPDIDKNSSSRMLPKVIECIETAGDVVPFDTSTDVCLEIAAEEVK